MTPGKAILGKIDHDIREHRLREKQRLLKELEDRMKIGKRIILNL